MRLKKLRIGWSFKLARILLLSNGHGEDLSGVLIGKALEELNHKVAALPLVGFGNSYASAGIRTLGKTKEFSTGGLGYTSIFGRITELLQGQLFYLCGRLLNLLLASRDYDLLVVVGDVVPVLAAWLTGLPVVTYLVAYSSHYEGKLRLPWPCSNLLSSKRFLAVFTRDQLTADDLTIQLLRKVEFLGNPFMDPVLKIQPKLTPCTYRLGLLPGSRRPELDDNLLLILRVIELLPVDKLISLNISFDIALVNSLDNAALTRLVAPHGWELNDAFNSHSSLQLVHDHCRVNVHRDSFVEVLQSSDVLLSMAGTATEQAVGLGKPVLQLQGKGPQFTASFAEAQRRLLGPTIFCAEGRVGHQINLRKTGHLIIDLFARIKVDQALQRDCYQQAFRRLGSEGGSKRIAQAISNVFDV